MKILVALIFLALALWLVFIAVTSYRATAGTVADKLAAAWKGSLTIFVLAWGALVSASIGVLDTLSQVTGDPQFAQFADSLKGAVPPSLLPYLPPAIMAVGIAARLTHNPPQEK